MSNKAPRWIHEIPKPQSAIKGMKLTEEEKKEAEKEAKEFSEAVKAGKIDEWFYKK